MKGLYATKAILAVFPRPPATSRTSWVVHNQVLVDAPELHRSLGEILSHMSHRGHLGEVSERLLERVVKSCTRTDLSGSELIGFTLNATRSS